MSKSPTFDNAAQWLSRTIALMLLLVLPGWLGLLLDKQFETKFFAALGFLVGIAFTTGLLLLFVQKMIPKAHGKAIPFVEVEDDEQLQDKRNVTGE